MLLSISRSEHPTPTGKEQQKSLPTGVDRYGLILGLQTPRASLIHLCASLPEAVDGLKEDSHIGKIDQVDRA